MLSAKAAERCRQSKGIFGRRNRRTTRRKQFQRTLDRWQPKNLGAYGATKDLREKRWNGVPDLALNLSASAGNDHIVGERL